jgi:hypothetical protein
MRDTDEGKMGHRNEKIEEKLTKGEAVDTFMTKIDFPYNNLKLNLQFTTQSEFTITITNQNYNYKSEFYNYNRKSELQLQIRILQL